MKTLGPPTAKDVLDFWLGDGLERGWCSDARDELWFGGGPELDASIQARFGTLVEQAIAGGLREWEDRIDTRLALVLLLDQFTRNMYRGQAHAFAGDARAQQLSTQAHASGMDAELATVGLVFLTMPLVHAEDLALQVESVRRFLLVRIRLQFSRRDQRGIGGIEGLGLGHGCLVRCARNIARAR